ncbi:MAG TPA: SPOR domain-containing protein [Parvibaculum sp.]
MSKKPASLTSDLLARKGEAEPSSIDPAARMTLSAGPDFPPYGSGGFGGHGDDGEGRPRPPEPEIIYTAEETRSGGGSARLIIGAVLALIVIGGIVLTLSSRTDRGVAPVSPGITTQQAPAAATEQTPPSETATAEPAAPGAPAASAVAPETPATTPAAPQPETTPTPQASMPQASTPQAAAPEAATVPAEQPQNPAATAEPAPVQSPEVQAPAAEEPAPAEKPVAAKPASKGVYVLQLQALRDEKSARASWAHLTKRYAALSGHALDIERADLGDKGVWYRVRAAGFATKAAAAGTCAKLKSAGQDCIVKRR